MNACFKIAAYISDTFYYSLAAQQQVLGGSDPSTVDTQNSTAALLSCLARQVEAEALRAQLEGTLDWTLSMLDTIISKVWGIQGHEGCLA